jgi:hypothetical protein
MFKLPYVLGILFATLALFEADAQTQRPPMADFLFNEHVSLMDWGIMRAKKDIERAVERLNKEIDEEVKADPRWRTLSQKEWSSEFDECLRNHKDDWQPCLDKPKFYVNQLDLRQFNYAYETGYAGWLPDQQRIVIGAAALPNRARIKDEDAFTASGCTDLLHDLKAALLSVYGIGSPALLMQFWFEYSGSRWRVGDFDRIVAITNVEVKLSRSGGALGKWYDQNGNEMGTDHDIECSQPLNGGPTTSHDHRQKQ